MKNALVKIISVVLTLAAVIVAVGLFKPTSASANGKLKIDVLLWDLSKDTDKYRVGLENGLDSSGGATIQVDPTNKNLLHIETKIPTLQDGKNPVFSLYKNKENATFSSEDTKNLINEQDKEKATKIAEVEFKKEDVQQWKEETKVQIFEGVKKELTSASDHVPAKQYFVIDKTKTNVFTIYLSSSGPDETLGTFGWGKFEGLQKQWGSDKGDFYNFKVAGELKGKKVAVSHITSETNAGSGYIVMNKPEDSGKLTGDIKDENFFKEDFKPNTSKFIAVIGKGAPHTDSDNVFALENIPQAAKDAFSFGFIPEKITSVGLGGTTAKDKRTIFASTSIAVNFEGETEEEKAKKLKEWFTVTTKDKKETIEVKEVQTTLSGKSSSDFVVLLNSDLDNTKEYILSFNNKKDGEEAQKAEVNLSLDKSAPVIEFLNLEDDKVQVPFNKEFDFTLIPKYKVTDDRDGDITQELYVPGEDEKNAKRFIDPGKEGEYEVLFKVVDTWGNVSEKTITFVVKK